MTSKKAWRAVMAWNALALLCGAAQSVAGPVEDNVISAFESFCLDNLDAPNITTKLAEALHLTQIAEPDLSIIMGDHPGRAWSSFSENQKYFIKFSNDGICSISSPVADGTLVRTLFVKLSRNKLLSSENVGSETQSIFAVTYPDPRDASDGHAIVMVKSSELQSVGGAALTSVPEKTAKAGGMTIPVWP